MNDEPDDSALPTSRAMDTVSSPLHRISQVPPVSSADAEKRRSLLEAKTSNRRYWVRLNVSPLGWVALVEQNETGATSTLGDVLDLGGGGCVMLLSSLPQDLLAGNREVTISIRPGPDQIVTCPGEVLGWDQTENGIQLRIAFRSADAGLQKQLNDIAYAARLRLLQISYGDE